MTPTDIIIPVHGSAEFPHVDALFDHCVNSVAKFTTSYRFIFIDDNSWEQTRVTMNRIGAAIPDSLVVRTNKQHWFTRAVNTGLRLVRTPYAVVLNCDTVCDENWLEELYAVKDEVEQSGRVGLVGSIQSGEEPRRYALSEGQDYVTGHAWLLRMDALNEVANDRGTPGIYLDETRVDTIHIRSDVFICWDLNRLGWKCVKAFKSNVGHIGGQTWGQQLWRIPNSLDIVNYKY